MSWATDEPVSHNGLWRWTHSTDTAFSDMIDIFFYLALFEKSLSNHLQTETRTPSTSEAAVGSIDQVEPR